MQLIKDRFERIIDYLRISVTDRCNLRCIYCMPPEGVSTVDQRSVLSFEEILKIARISAGLGVRKIRLTGGEPLVRKELPLLVEGMSQIEGIEDISLTTNGQLLKHHARVLADAGLNRINISLDSLNAERYSRITRGGSMDEVLQGIEKAEEVGLDPIKINMIPIRGVNDDELEAFARLTWNTPYHVRFIELMPTGTGSVWSRERCVAADEIKERVSTLAPLVPVKVRRSGPARYFRFENARGVIGFISPVTHHFCDSCNRLRLTSDGKIRPCLFSGAEIDLKSAMRSGASDNEIERLLKLAVEIKPERHHLEKNRDTSHFSTLMSRIGG
jgi:cyclic pyranopterin phosphate synthase